MENLGVDWFMPGRKRRFASTTVATRDLIEFLGERGFSVVDAFYEIKYDLEGKGVLGKYIEAGYGLCSLSDLLSNRI